MVNMVDCGAVIQFPFPENPKSVCTYGYLHCHEYDTSLRDRLHACFSQVFISIFETTLFL